MVWKYVDESGNVTYYRYDDGSSWWDFGRLTGGKIISSTVYAGLGGGISLTTSTTMGELKTSSTLDMLIDPGKTGDATVFFGDDAHEDTLVSNCASNQFLNNSTFGQVLESDSLISNCSYNAFNGMVETDTLTFNSWFGLTRYIDADYTATATDWQILVEDTARVTLPALSIAYDSLTTNTGYSLQLDIWASTDACTISTVADSIWGNTEIVLSPRDNASLRAGKDWWILR
jgi:hypothetical protein